MVDALNQAGIEVMLRGLNYTAEATRTARAVLRGLNKPGVVAADRLSETNHCTTVQGADLVSYNDKHDQANGDPMMTEALRTTRGPAGPRGRPATGVWRCGCANPR